MGSGWSESQVVVRSLGRAAVGSPWQQEDGLGSDSHVTVLLDTALGPSRPCSRGLDAAVALRRGLEDLDAGGPPARRVGRGSSESATLPWLAVAPTRTVALVINYDFDDTRARGTRNLSVEDTAKTARQGSRSLPDSPDDHDLGRPGSVWHQTMIASGST